MNVKNALLLFTHLLASAGFISIVSTGEVGTVVAAIFTVALVNSYVKERYGKGYFFPNNFLTFIGICITLFVLYTTFFMGVEIIQGVLVFLIWIQIVKLLGKKEFRDIMQIYVLSFFQFLAGTVLTVSFSYGLSFIVYVTIAVWSIIALNLRKESMEAAGDDHNLTLSDSTANQGRNGSPMLVTPYFLASTALVSFMIFIFTALIFVSVPRLGLGFLQSKFLSPKQLKSGFSDKVELGKIGEIKRDNSPVMTVKITNAKKEDLPNPIYWRGIALDHFDGRIWRVGNHSAHYLRSDWNDVIRVADVMGKVLVQEIISEPVDSRVIFASSTPVAFKNLITRTLLKVNDSYLLTHSGVIKLKYIAYSDIVDIPLDSLRSSSDIYPPNIKSRYLQQLHIGDRIKRLAASVTEDESNPYDMADAIKNYLVTNLSYTTTLEEGEASFPLENFLFQQKAGHCEYFATAMVIMLRTIGIPSRIVNGFLGGEWNEPGQFFMVRQSDAHSWVEVYFPEQGWVTFDPTPPDLSSYRYLGLLGTVTSYFDYVKYRWSRYIVDFGTNDQRKIISAIKDRWKWQKKKTENKLKFKLKFDKKYFVIFIVIAVAFWVFFIRGKGMSFFDRTGKKPLHKASSIYKKGLNFLSKKGFKKKPHDTPNEFALSVENESKDSRGSVSEFTEKYLLLRYADVHNQEDFKELESLLEKLKKKFK